MKFGEKYMIGTVKSINEEVKNNTLLAFASTIIIGIIAHGFMFNNKISFFDDITSIDGYSGVWLLIIGRYFLGILKIVNDHLFGTYSNSFFNGIVSLILIAVANAMIVKILNLRKCINIIFASSVIILSTGLVCLYAYMFTAIFYSIAILLSIFSTYIFVFYFDSQRIPFLKIIIVAFLLYLTISIYQTYFLFGVIVYLLYILTLIFNHKIDYKNILYYITAVILSLILYIFTNNIFFKCFSFFNNVFNIGYNSIGPSSYQGIDRISSFGFMSKDGLVEALKHILIADDIVFKNNIYIYLFLLILLALTITYIIIYINKYNIFEKLCLLSTVFFIIVSANSIYILSANTYLYALPLYPKCLIFLLPIVFLEYLDYKQVIKNIISLILIYYIFYNCALANNIYINRFFRLCNEISWCQTLATRIQSISGYNDEYDVFVYGDTKNDLKYNNKNLLFDSISPYNINSLNAYNFNRFMEYWTGFKMQSVKQNVLGEYDDIIESMNCYPDDGSIRVVEDKILIKFSNIDK